MPTKVRPGYTLTDQLRMIVESRGLTPYALGQMAEVDAGVVSRWMNGRRDIRLATADKLALALGVRLAELSRPVVVRKPTGPARAPRVVSASRPTPPDHPLEPEGLPPGPGPGTEKLNSPPVFGGPGLGPSAEDPAAGRMMVDDGLVAPEADEGLPTPNCDDGDTIPNPASDLRRDYCTGTTLVNVGIGAKPESPADLRKPETDGPAALTNVEPPTNPLLALLGRNQSGNQTASAASPCGRPC